MPKFFFSLYDHFVELDDEGTELADVAAARIEAIRYAGELLRDEPHFLDDGNTLVIRVTDEARAEAFRVEMRAIAPT